MGICIASMIGSGIFSVPGLIGPSLGTQFNVLLAWTLGGVLALLGAFVIAELAAQRPTAGAVYHTVHETLGHGLGYLYGMIGLLVGYIASLALIALIAAAYVKHLFPDLDTRVIATLIVAIPASLHAWKVIAGARFNDVLVVLKLALVGAFIVAGFTIDVVPIEAPANAPVAPAPLSMAVGAAVIQINFAYLGWSSVNAVAGEVRNPARTLPLAILGSVGVVTVTYLLINVVYMRVIAPGAMVGPDKQPMADIGAIVATKFFGETGGTLVSLAIIGLLISTITTMLFTGSRLLIAMSWKGELPKRVGQLNSAGAPTFGVALYGGMAIALLWLAPIGQLLEFTGFIMTFCAALAGLSIFVLRRRCRTRPFSMPAHPLPTVLFLALSAWLLFASMRERPMVAMVSAGVIVAILVARRWLTRPTSTRSSTYTKG
jgi:APA family basic amino acid/polyamine antiporter